MLRRVNLTMKVAALVALAVALTAMAVWVAASRELRRELEAKQRIDSERHLHRLALALANRLQGVKVTVEHGRVVRLEAPSLADFADVSVVDDAVSSFDGTATIFAFDPASGQFVRRVTTVENGTGGRAIGTILAPDSPAQLQVRRGEAYYGPAVLFGQHMHAAYQPVLDSAGQVNGLLYVGSPVGPYGDAYRETMRTLTVAAGLMACLACLGAGIAAGGMFEPLKVVSGRAEALARGDLADTIRHQGRSDEIGAIARALESVRVVTARLTGESRAPQSGGGGPREEIEAAVQEFRQGAAELLIASLAASPQASELRGGVAEEADRAVPGSPLGHLREAADNIARVAAAAEDLRQSLGKIADRHDGRGMEQGHSDPQDMEPIEVLPSGQGAALPDTSDVVGLIRAVADQMNRLGLNLTLEVARASDPSAKRSGVPAANPEAHDRLAALERRTL